MSLGTPNSNSTESLPEDRNKRVLHCPTCYSTNFQTSRMRAEDRLHWFFFKQPVRCRKCNARIYASRTYFKWLRGKEASGVVEKSQAVSRR